MVIDTALPFSLCKSKIHLFRQWSCYVTFINYIIKKTVPFHWTFYFFSAIAFWFLVTWFWCNFFIMPLDDLWHIVHATVADFNCTGVENFVCASWKMFCYQLKECFCSVCWNGFAKGWVKPYYVSLSCFLFFRFLVGVFQINIITQVLYRIFIFNFHCVKNFLVRRIFRESFRDGIWQLFDDLQWMVWRWVNVKQLVRFLVWTISAILLV